MAERNPPAEDILKILIATDNHLGYCEKDPIRGQDSYDTFEEILQHAAINDVDFILLGGDLFHDANPTTNALNKCMRLLRQYTLGDKPIQFEFLSNQNQNFQSSFNGMVNYQDPNINVGIPVFSIHGNHDDPSGFAQLSSLDLLSTSGLVNYFGKSEDLTKINIDPLMIKKGDTKLALYGLSYIHDSRLIRIFHDAKITMGQPEIDPDTWFNLMVVHQNRNDRGPKNFLPEEVLPKCLDLVLWGHEHECLIRPEVNNTSKIPVTQPGSSVATSLCEGEAQPKHCGLLTIYKKEFSIQEIKLETVRPFVFRTIDLKDHEDEIYTGTEESSKNVLKFVANQIDEMLKEAEKQLTSNRKQPKLPLIRLRIVYHNEDQMFNQIRFGQDYYDKVANTKDMITFKKAITRSYKDPSTFDKDVFDQQYANGIQEDDGVRVEDIVGRYFKNVESSKQLKVFSIESLTEMCRQLVQYDDDDAVTTIIKYHKEKLCEHLNEIHPDETVISDEIKSFQISKSNEIVGSMQKLLDSRGKTTAAPFNPDNVMMDENSDDDDDVDRPQTNAPPPAATKRGAAASTRGRGRGRGRGAKAEPPKSSRGQLNVSTAKSTRNVTQTTIQSSMRKATSRVSYVDDDSD